MSESYKQLRVEDALAYLDKARGQWGGGGEVPLLAVHDAPQHTVHFAPPAIAAAAAVGQVKTQFGHRPVIYNKFLEIMKAFKAQT
jgi:histone deacetylase complex regulatory component SIN3